MVDEKHIFAKMIDAWAKMAFIFTHSFSKHIETFAALAGLNPGTILDYLHN